MISSLDESLAMLHKYEEERRPIWFSISVAGVFFVSNGLVSEVSETSLKLAPHVGGEVLILWDIFDVATVEYFEPRDVPREYLSAFMVERDGPLAAFWRITSSREGLGVGCLLLGVFAA